MSKQPKDINVFLTFPVEAKTRFPTESDGRQAADVNLF
jgi:hypothetical protein